MGVLIDDKLQFHAHTASRSVTAKANSILAIIHKSFHFTDNDVNKPVQITIQTGYH